MMGVGLWTSEEIKFHPETGALLTKNTWVRLCMIDIQCSKRVAISVKSAICKCWIYLNRLIIPDYQNLLYYPTICRKSKCYKNLYGIFKTINLKKYSLYIFWNAIPFILKWYAIISYIKQQKAKYWCILNFLNRWSF